MSFDLYSLSANALFEKYSLQEIRAIQNDLQTEINKKQNEICALVGEKYRDFIDVTDKICHMSNLAESISKNVGQMALDYTTLVNKQPVEVTNCNYDSNKKTESNSTNTVAVLVKLLIDIEDYIWSEIDDGKFVTATILLQLVMHIKTTLTLETKSEVTKKFSVLDKLWLSFLQFPAILTQEIDKKLKMSDLTLEDFNQCACSITILDHLTANEVIQRILSQRKSGLMSILNVDDVKSNVRTYILQSLKLLINTFVILYYGFNNLDGDNNGTYWTKMRSIFANDCDIALSYINLDHCISYGRRFIPTNVLQFKIKYNHKIEPIGSSEYQVHINEWLKWMRSYAKTHIEELLNIITSLNSLQLLNESVPSLPENWKNILEYFHLNGDLNFWSDLYRPLIVERAKVLLSDRWKVTFDSTREELESLIKTASNKRTKEPENDMHWFLWKEVEEIIKSDSDLINDLKIRSSWLSPNSGKICLFVEKEISLLMNQLYDVCPQKNFETDEAETFKLHQQQCCEEYVQSLLDHCTNLVELHADDENSLLFLARILTGIPLFCGSFKQCILLADKEGEKWIKVNNQLQTSSLNIWRKWYSLVITPMLNGFCNQLQTSSCIDFRIRQIPKWNDVQMNGADEDGNEINLDMKVPFQATIPLQNFLNKLSILIGRSLPPGLIVEEMLEHIVEKCIDCYESCCTDSSQTISIQFLFDVKYISALLVPVDATKLFTHCNEVISKIENKVDPVDMDTISSYLTENVKQFLIKTQGLHGILITNNRYIGTSQLSDNTEDPNVVFVNSVNTPWWQLPASAMHPSFSTIN